MLSLAQEAREIMPSVSATECHMESSEGSPVGNICADVEHLQGAGPCAEQHLGQANQGGKDLAAFLFCGRHTGHGRSGPSALASATLCATHGPPHGEYYVLSYLVSGPARDAWRLKANEKAGPRNTYTGSTVE